MLRNLLIGLLILAPPELPVIPQPEPRKTPVPVTSVTVKVDAASGWQDSGVDLKSGQYYSVTAKGNWVSGSGSPVGPEGNMTGGITSDALVGMIAKSRPPQLGYQSYTKETIEKVILIREGGYFKTLTTGTLWLAMGDWSGCKECLGKIEVLIIVYY